MSEPIPRRKRKVKVNVEDVKAALQERKRINSPDIRDLEFYKDGKRVQVPEEVIEWFASIGLNNIDFIESYFLGGTRFQVMTMSKANKPKEATDE
jgi:uncharacterized membrane protein YvbJ